MTDQATTLRQLMRANEIEPENNARMETTLEVKLLGSDALDFPIERLQKKLGTALQLGSASGAESPRGSLLVLSEGAEPAVEGELENQVPLYVIVNSVTDAKAARRIFLHWISSQRESVLQNTFYVGHCVPSEKEIPVSAKKNSLLNWRNGAELEVCLNFLAKRLKTLAGIPMR